MESALVRAVMKSATPTAKRGGDDAASEMRVLDRLEGETSAEYAYRCLRYNIFMCIMAPGSLLREASVAGKLGVSKTPVHQAIGKLREQLLVDVEPQSATHVSKINVSAMRQGSLLRTDVEAATLFRMAGRLPSAYIMRLGECLARQRETLTADDIDIHRVGELDDEFHRVVFEGSGLEFTWRLIKAASSHYDRVRYMGLVYGFSEAAEFYKDHEDFYKRLAFGTRLTKDQLYTFMYGHLNHYVEFFDQMVIDHADYFDFGPVPGDSELTPESTLGRR